MLKWWHVRLVIEFGIAREAVSEDVKQALGAASIGIFDFNSECNDESQHGLG